MKFHLSVMTAGVLALASVAPAVAANNTCIQGYNIENTERPNDTTILFHMKDGSTYVNHTVGRCVGLAIDPEGFTYEPTNSGSDELCSNLMTIRLNSTQQVCLLGEFDKVPKK